MQESTRAATLGKTLGTLGQGVDSSGAPTYFMGVPSGAAGAPGSAPPAAGPAPTPTPGGVTERNIRQFAGIGPDGLASNAPSPHIPIDPNAQAQLQADITRAQGGQPASPNPAGVIRPGNAPGQNEFMQGRAAEAAKRDTALITLASESPTRVNVLDNIIGLSKSGVNTGPTAEWTNKVKGVMAGVPGLEAWKDDVTGYQEMKKYLKQNGIRAWQAAGGSGTDSQLSAAMEANPNDKMFPKAVQMMANWAKAGEIAVQGKANAAQKAGINTPQEQARFESTWRQNMDPRIYQMRLMDPAEAATFVDKLKKSDPAGYQSLLKKAQNLSQMGGL